MSHFLFIPFLSSMCRISLLRHILRLEGNLKKEKYTEAAIRYEKKKNKKPQVYSIPRASETNYDKVGGLNQQKFLLCRSGGPKSEISVLAVLDLSGSSEIDSNPCFSPSF